MLAMYLCIEMSHTGLKNPNTVLTNIWFASSQTLIQNHTWCTNNTVILLGSIALFLTCMLRNQLSQFWKLNEHILLGFNDEIWITKKQAKAVWSQLVRSYCWFKNSVFIICKPNFFSMQENIFKKWQKPMHSYLN